MKKIFTILLLLCAIGSFAQVRISQVYGGGGNASATYNQDFVELFNAGVTSVDVSGWSIQYASATGPGTTPFNWAVATIPASTSIGAGKYFLVALATGATGIALPTPDFTFTGINLSGTAGKVALVNTATPLNGTTACSNVNVIDVLGFGTTATCSETSPFNTTGIGNTLSMFRKTNGCTESNNNSTDFEILSVLPRNSSTIANLCGATGPSISAGGNITNLTTTVGVTSASQSFNLSASNLTPAAGNVSITPSAGLEFSFDNISFFTTSQNLIYAAGTIASTPIYVRITNTAPQGIVSGNITISGGGASNAVVTVSGAVSQNYYNTKANLGLTNTGTWSSTLNGLGSSPANFTDPYQYFNIVSQANVTYTGVWNVTGAESKVIVGDGTAAISFEVNSGADSVTSATKIDVLNNGLLGIFNTRIPTLNILATGSTVNFGLFGTSTADTVKIPAISYFNLYLTSGLKYFSAGTTTVRGNLLADAVQSMNGSLTPFSTINAFGNVDFANGSVFAPLPLGDAARLTLKMNGPGPVQPLNGDGTEIMLFRLQRDSTSANIIQLGANTNLTLGNAASGGLQLTPAAATLNMGANTINLIAAGSSTTAALGKISSANGSINVLKSVGAADAGTLRFTTGTVLAQITVNLGAVVKDSISIADNVTVGFVNLLRGTIVMTPGDTLSATLVSAPSVQPYSFVDGALRLTGTSNLGFAVGKGNNFAPLLITNFGGTNSSYTVHYFNTGYGNYTIDPVTLGTYPAYEVSKSLYWRVTSSNVNPYDAVFGYTDDTANIKVPNLIRMANFDNTDWADLGGVPNPANTIDGGTISVTGITVFGPFTFSALTAGVVPVKLSSFAAQKSGNATRVTWSTEQELNSKEFLVERSTDGGRTWVSISVVPAAGNSSIKINYSIIDNSPAKGVNLYRLRAVDADDKFTLSNTRAVLFSNADVVLITPNPASSYINILMSKNNNSLTQIVVADVNGKIVERINTPDQTYQVNVSRYAKGIYIIKVMGAENTSIQKVIVQ